MATIDFTLPQSHNNVMDMSVLIGTITAIDYINDKADIDIDGYGSFSDVEIYYHCGGETSFAGGSEAFEIGDTVYVLNPFGSCSPNNWDLFRKLRIIGFTDGLHSCVKDFTIKFTRGDGAVVTEDWFTGGAGSDTISVIFKNSSKVIVAMTRSYDPVTQYFTFSFPFGHVIDPNGYWIYSTGYRSFSTFYPSSYKTSEQYSISDLLQPNTYEFHMPYWTTDSIYSGDYDSTLTHTLKVWSSVPWDAQYSIFGWALRDCFAVRKRDYRIDEQSPVWCDQCCHPLGYWETFNETGVSTASIAVSGGGLLHNEGGFNQPEVDLATTPIAGTMSPIAGATYTMAAANSTPDVVAGANCDCIIGLTPCGRVGKQAHFFVSNSVSFFNFGPSIARYPWED